MTPEEIKWINDHIRHIATSNISDEMKLKAVNGLRRIMFVPGYSELVDFHGRYARLSKFARVGGLSLLTWDKSLEGQWFWNSVSYAV